MDRKFYIEKIRYLKDENASLWSVLRGEQGIQIEDDQGSVTFSINVAELHHTIEKLREECKRLRAMSGQTRDIVLEEIANDLEIRAAKVFSKRAGAELVRAAHAIRNKKESRGP